YNLDFERSRSLYLLLRFATNFPWHTPPDQHRCFQGLLAPPCASPVVRSRSNLRRCRPALLPKRAELENLRQLRDLSGTLAIQMQALDSKISTLKDGTEAVAYVLSNWDNVIRAITLASSKAGGLGEPESDSKNVEKPRNDLPSTLVRIPAEPRDKTGE
ncbi:uncharacterized protein N7487_003395, partial [Penicillium crustosum]|uniref:uncharacterized protein n=1 Tax=Penicillium crustosum TaxID=36656 RepID=UPI00239FC015